MLLGLTGGIATGKTTFRQLLTTLRPLEVFDADACVHALLDDDPEVATAIGAAFGRRAIPSPGPPDKAFLRDRIYADPDARRQLESILHPRVRARWQKQAESCRAAHRDFLADIPLLYETGAQDHFDAVILVASSPDIQRTRLQRRGVDAGLAERMLASQWPIGEKVRLATHVVWNDGDLGALQRQAAHLTAALWPSTA